MFHGGILWPLKSDLAVFWAKIPPSSDWFYNVKTQKTHFLQNRPTEMAKIENMHYTICLQLIFSSGQIVLPPAFAWLEQRGASTAHTSKYLKFLCLSPEKHVITNSKLFCDYMSRITLPLCHLCVYMGQFLQGGKNGRLMSFFFKSRASVWPNLMR